MMTRRHLLRAALSSAAAAVLAACTGKKTPGATATRSPAASSTPTPSPTTTVPVPACVVRPELTEGPYFVDEKINRADIREDREGVPLRLRFNVAQLDAAACTALQGAQVDVWHCDAAGTYSDVVQNSTSGQKFLRGYQLTDAAGRAEFTTIFPGWYRGRAIHIHFKIRSGNRAFTSQLFFDDATINSVMARAPYSGRGAPDTPNSADGIFGQSGGRLTLALTQDGSGYAGAFDIGLQT
jgi:protocatechuate 3,4-dioxygenase beta subunit